MVENVVRRPYRKLGAKTDTVLNLNEQQTNKSKINVRHIYKSGN